MVINLKNIDLSGPFKKEIISILRLLVTKFNLFSLNRKR